MRVTIATRIFAPEPAAAAFRLTALANALAESGASVTVLTGRIRGDSTPGLDDRVLVRRAPVLRDRAGFVRGYLQYLSFDIPLAFRLLLGRRPDVVVAEPPPMTGAVAAIAGRIRRVPVVYYAGDVWSDALGSTTVPRVLVTMVSALERAVLSAAARVIAVSDGVAASVTAHAPSAQVEVVRNGVDTEVFRPDGARADSPPYVIYAGTTSEWQGAEIFIHALRLLRQRGSRLRLVYLGQGSAWESLRDLAARSGLLEDVQFVATVPPEQAADWLRGARAALVSLRPGQGYDFAIPTKIYAGLACGTPVVFAGAREAAAAELIRASGLGTSVPFDAEEVAAAVDSLASGPRDEQRAVELSDWVRVSASLARSGADAATIVRGAAIPRP